MEPVPTHSAIPVLTCRPDSVRRLTEIAANLVIICAIVFSGTVWLHRHFTATQNPVVCGANSAQAPLPGTQINLGQRGLGFSFLDFGRRDL